MANRKFRRLARALGSEVVARGSLELLWDSAYESGDDYLGDSTDVEAAARWNGEPGVLTKALLDAGGEGHTGFIEKIPGCSDLFRVHDLWHHAPDYVRKRRQREVERRAKADPVTDSTVSDQSVTGQWQPSPDCQDGVDRTPSPSPRGNGRSANARQFADDKNTPFGTPKGLTSLEYARMILEERGLPETGNIILVAQAISADAKKNNLTEAQAFDFIREQVRKDHESGEEINRFYWTDGKYRRGEKAKKQEADIAAERARPGKQYIAEIEQRLAERRRERESGAQPN